MIHIDAPKAVAVVADDRGLERPSRLTSCRARATALAGALNRCAERARCRMGDDLGANSLSSEAIFQPTFSIISIYQDSGLLEDSRYWQE